MLKRAAAGFGLALLLSVVGALAQVPIAAGTALAEPDLCVSTSGVQRVQKGTAGCGTSTGKGNVAIARGLDASAVAGVLETDEHNRAKATGIDSAAAAWRGDGNTATVDGNGSVAVAFNGDNNTATVDGVSSTAYAQNGDGNTATVDGESSSAFAGFGDGNTATVDGDGSGATAVDPDGCTAEASGDGQTSSCP